MPTELESLEDFPPTNISSSAVGSDSESKNMDVENVNAADTWFRRRLGRPPTGPDVYAVAVRLYNSGCFGECRTALQLYRGTHIERLRGGQLMELNSLNLAAYAAWRCGRNEEAMETLQQLFKAASARDPRMRTKDEQFEGSWQLLVELAVSSMQANSAQDQATSHMDKDMKHLVEAPDPSF